MATVLVATCIAAFALLVVGALALQVYGRTGRVEKLEKAREVERRHREHLTLQVERLQEKAARVPLEPEEPVVGAVLKNLGPRFKQ